MKLQHFKYSIIFELRSQKHRLDYRNSLIFG